ncbi:glycosyltransferase family 2 protein [Vibrio breoganii]
MKFSLILCTVGRDKEVELFLESIVKQRYVNFEIVLVDQNLDNRIEFLLNKFPSLVEKINLIKSEKGLSKARNIGLQYVDGDIIAFPDDDCIYSEDVLERVFEFFSSAKEEQVVYSTNTCDITTGFSLIACPTSSVNFDKDTLMGCSFTLFFRGNLKSLKFDERMGVGSGFIWGSGEESDFLYRALENRSSGHFEPDVYVYHPAKEQDTVDFQRAYYYGAGLAAFRCKHFSKFRAIKSSLLLCYEILKALTTFKLSKAAFKLGYLLGYIMGLLAWKLTIR